MSTFYLVGLMYFDGCDRDESRALLPNGTQQAGHIPPHYGSFILEKNAVNSFDWFDAPISHTVDTGAGKVDLLEFRIPPKSEIQFPLGKKTKKCVNFVTGLPKLKKADPTFDPDFQSADSVAEFSIRSGTLEPFLVDDTPVVKWTVDDGSDPIDIKVWQVGKGHDDEPVRSIQVKKDGEIVLANTPEFLATVPPAAATGHDHFELFGKIAKSKNGSKLKNTGLLVPPSGLQTSHGYIKFLENSHALTTGAGGGSCSGTCCGM